MLVVGFLSVCAAADPPQTKPTKSSKIGLDFQLLEDLRNKLKPEPDMRDPASFGSAVNSPIAVDGTGRLHSRKSVVGRTVRVEGIAWGGTKAPVTSPHAGPHIAYQNGSIFVKGIDFAAEGSRGRIVRVEGVLRRMPPTLAREPGRSRIIPGHYFIEAKSHEVLEFVIDPRLVLVRPNNEESR